MPHLSEWRDFLLQAVLVVEGRRGSRLRRHAFRWLQSLHLGRDS